MQRDSWVLYGTHLSPFALKVAAALTYSHVPFKWVFQLNAFAAIRYELWVNMLRLGLFQIDIPKSRTDLEELPLVPFLFSERDRKAAYDSTAILDELSVDAHLDSPSNEFMSYLLEEFFDEWGLYIVHHNRWTDLTNRISWGNDVSKSPGYFLNCNEMLKPYPKPHALSIYTSNIFNRRQTRRLPYLFSVDKLNASRLKIPETVHLLDSSFERLLDGLELIYMESNYMIPGSAAFTKADLSCFGQFNMNALLEIGTREKMKLRSPTFLRWLDEMQCTINEHVHLKELPQVLTEPKTNSVIARDENPQSGSGMAIILSECVKFFIPLMRANAKAFEIANERGETIYNEAAFDKGRCIFSSEFEMEGRVVPYSQVVKTFQVGVWSNIMSKWNALSAEDIFEIETRYKFNIREAFEKQISPVSLQVSSKL